MTIDAEKLRALSRSCEYTVKVTEAGDVSELWAVRFDVMGRPYHSRIGVTSHGGAALIAAAVNALPELLDALADVKAQLAFAIAGGAPSGPPCVVCESLEDAQAKLATAEAERDEAKAAAIAREQQWLDVLREWDELKAERLTLARRIAFDTDPTGETFADMTNGEIFESTELARRIVAEADAASKEVGS